MAEYVGSAASNATGVTKEFAVADTVTVYDGDFVYLSSGRVTNASIAGNKLIGMVVGGQSNDPSDHTDTQSATGNTAGTVKVLVIVEPDAKFAVTNDNVGTTFAVTHVGTRFDLIGAAGAQLVDTSTTGTTGQLECIGFSYENDDTVGLYVIAEHNYKA